MIDGRDILLRHVLFNVGWWLDDRGDETLALRPRDGRSWPPGVPVPRITCWPVSPGGREWLHWVGSCGLIPICPAGHGDVAVRLITTTLDKHVRPGPAAPVIFHQQGRRPS